MSTQILSIEENCTFRFLNFLIIVLCNDLANFWFEIFSFLIPPPEVKFSSKHLLTIEARPL